MDDVIKFAAFDGLCKLEGFEGLDLDNYDVARQLTPYILGPMKAVETWDLRVDRVVLNGHSIRCHAEQPTFPKGRELKFDVIEKRIPRDLLDHLKDLSAGPRPEWPYPKIPTEVEGVLNRLDELLFGEDAKPGRVIMNVYTYADVRKWRGMTVGCERLDILSKTELLKMGWQATLYHPEFKADTATVVDFALGRQIWTSRSVPKGAILIDNSDPTHWKAPGVWPDDKFIHLGGPYDTLEQMLEDVIAYAQCHPKQTIVSADNALKRLYGFELEDGSRRWEIRASDAGKTGNAINKHLAKAIKEAIGDHPAKLLLLLGARITFAANLAQINYDVPKRLPRCQACEDGTSGPHGGNVQCDLTSAAPSS